MEFNLRIWEELLADPDLAKIDNRIETDRHGRIMMLPIAGPLHGLRQATASFQLASLLSGRPIVECPVSTADGVRAVDVGWFSEPRYARAFDERCFLEAPEICVEILSPSNNPAEIGERMAPLL